MVLLCFVGKPQIPPTDRDVFTTLLLSFDPGITILPEFPLYPILGNPRFTGGAGRGLSGSERGGLISSLPLQHRRALENDFRAYLPTGPVPFGLPESATVEPFS